MLVQQINSIQDLENCKRLTTIQKRQTSAEIVLHQKFTKNFLSKFIS